LYEAKEDESDKVWLVSTMCIVLISMYIHWTHYLHTNSHNELDIQTKRGWFSMICI